MTNTQKAQEIINALRDLIPDPKIALIYSNPWELFVSVVLSAQTTDKQVNIVTKDLFKKYSSFEDYTSVSWEKFAEDVRRIGLYKGKAKNIITSAKIIEEKYNGKVPETMEELVALPGVGRKTANILLSNIYNLQVGIAVDTHVKRLTRLWGLTNNTDPIKIEDDLMQIVPKKDWKDFSYLVILYGREYCTASCKHLDCPLNRYIV